jgi:hypothetical protein
LCLGSRGAPYLACFCEMWGTRTLIWVVEEFGMAKAVRWSAVESHISPKTSEIPGFPVRGFIRDRVCGFH